MKKYLKKFMARHRRSAWVRKIAHGSRAIWLGYSNLSYDMQDNGESRVLRIMSDFDMNVIFDVGANTGEWSRLAATLAPSARIHAFEILPQTAAKFRDNLAGVGNVRLNVIGLSDRSGEDTLHAVEGQSYIASCVPDFTEGFHKQSVSSITVQTTTTDAYCEEHGIETIDFLKVDVEGYEHKVLKGCEALLQRGGIRVIQFEYGYVNIATRFLLQDFYAMLEARGFALGKIFPDHVEFRPYQYRDEDFLGPNFLAVLKTEQALIEALKN
jgi:FkbM family methyltransferase